MTVYTNYGTPVAVLKELFDHTGTLCMLLVLAYPTSAARAFKVTVGLGSIRGGYTQREKSPPAIQRPKEIFKIPAPRIEGQEERTVHNDTAAEDIGMDL